MSGHLRNIKFGRDYAFGRLLIDVILYNKKNVGSMLLNIHQHLVYNNILFLFIIVKCKIMIIHIKIVRINIMHKVALYL